MHSRPFPSARPLALCGSLLIVLVAAAPALAAVGGAGGVDPEALVVQGRNLTTRGKLDQALALYRRAMTLAPRLFDPHYGAGLVLDLQGHYTQARQELKTAIALAPPGARDVALEAMAVSWAFQADAARAAVYYRRIFDRQQKNGNLNGAAATADALGRVYLESGDPPHALEWYRRGYDTAMRQTDLDAHDRDLWKFRLAHAEARIAVRRGRVAAARRYVAAAKAIVDTPAGADQKPDYAYLVGYVDFYAGDYPAAIAALQRASQKDAFILGLLAQAYEKSGNEARARVYYEKVLTVNAHDIQDAFARPLAKRRLAAMK